MNNNEKVEVVQKILLNERIKEIQQLAAWFDDMRRTKNGHFHEGCMCERAVFLLWRIGHLYADMIRDIESTVFSREGMKPVKCIKGE